jgi:hypothetical protein
MPYALCPMPYALCTSEHVTEKGYMCSTLNSYEPRTSTGQIAEIAQN